MSTFVARLTTRTVQIQNFNVYRTEPHVGLSIIVRHRKSNLVWSYASNRIILTPETKIQGGLK